MEKSYNLLSKKWKNLLKNKTNQIWVSPNSNGGWRVHKANAKRDSSDPYKKQAILKATQIARNQRSELKVQNKDGKISQSNSFGRDPFPPKDRKQVKTKTLSFLRVFVLTN